MIKEIGTSVNGGRGGPRPGIWYNRSMPNRGKESAKQVLITGASGFIGSHLAEELANRGHRVSCLIRKSSRFAALKELPVRLVEADYRDCRSLAEAVKDIQWVFHLAGLITAPDWESYYAANCLSTQNLIDACLASDSRIERFIYVSSISATGPSPHGRMLNETDECRPVSDYGRSKLLAEGLVLSRGRQIPATIIRPPNVIGPRQKELYQVMRLLKKRIFPLLGRQEPQTSICFVSDLVEAMILAAAKPAAIGQIYFVTDPRPYSWHEIIRTVATAMGLGRLLVPVPFFLQYGLAWVVEAGARLLKKPAPISRQNLLATRDQYWIYDGDKICRQLGFKTATGLTEAMQHTVGFYRDRGLL